MDNKDSSDTAAASEVVRVSIFDQIYTLRSSKGSEHLKQIASVVDERMRQIAAHTTTFELSRIAVLAALNITDELQDLKARREEMAESMASTDAGVEPKAEATLPENSAGNEETGKAQTWFEAIFDAEVPVKDRSERLSTQVSSKLQTIRQDSSKDTDAPGKTDA
ncbi:MAG: cell division protein ZapA [Acidobacteria bacterium]|nr:cell division protein ZapA [Acidobacteriota bacterium]